MAQTQFANGYFGSKLAGCLHGVYAMIDVGLAQLNLRPCMTAPGRLREFIPPNQRAANAAKEPLGFIPSI